MNLPYIDIHTHGCAPETDVKKVCVHPLGAAKSLPKGVFVAGVHPWDVAEASTSALDFFGENHTGLVGVGEIGLDFARRDADKATQTEWLDKQLAIAARLDLPVVVHCVKAFNEMQAELAKHRLKAVVFHGFTGSPELAAQLIGRGYCLSFGASFLRSPKTAAALKSTPPDRLFLETDDEPDADIASIYHRAASVRGETTEQLKTAVFNNYKQAFNG